jgi:hypothetical protein
MAAMPFARLKFLCTNPTEPHIYGRRLLGRKWHSTSQGSSEGSEICIALPLAPVFTRVENLPNVPKRDKPKELCFATCHFVPSSHGPPCSTHAEISPWSTSQTPMWREIIHVGDMYPKMTSLTVRKWNLPSDVPCCLSSKEMLEVDGRMEGVR